ncbi:hypothetical protein HanXRQr2_Chr15g0719721 [Helianthus annuus]|uniref:Uncharacterized protein n=1 Tax=Helianthus annuus TaxID=4232 RepID=A0A9K3E5K4_HELAN|nr:hypothetical protein HanXRQr2_Chr15g0719721 [Helianthus annuus]KAJ0833443.1 hypothetical protein HanPSC8_Chr15g0690441 [Helianthus annuus]
MSIYQCSLMLDPAISVWDCTVRKIRYSFTSEWKQREKGEQRRLDEEGAAIAEAVALQVLNGEDSNDACGQVVNGKRIYRNAHGGSICRWNAHRFGENGSFVRGVEGSGSFVDEMSAAGLVTARAVSTLQIADDEDINAFVFKRMVKG